MLQSLRDWEGPLKSEILVFAKKAFTNIFTYCFGNKTIANKLVSYLAKRVALGGKGTKGSDEFERRLGSELVPSDQGVAAEYD